MRRFLLLLCISLPLFAFAQQSAQQQESRSGDEGGVAKPNSRLTAAQQKANQQRAKELLSLAESEARGLEPGGRAVTLMQVASGLVPMDRGHATSLLHDAFIASTSEDIDKNVKAFVQDRIFEELIPLDAENVPEMLPQAEPRARSRAITALIRRAAANKDFARANDLINQASTEPDSFPYEAVIAYLLALPPEDSASRLNAFMQAANAFARSDPKASGGGFNNTGFDRLVVRFGGTMPRNVAMDAISAILDRAKDSDSDAKFSLSSSNGSASFNSSYDYYLFELLPVIRRIDPSKADDLLKQNQQLQPVVTKFPNGVTSLDPTIRDTPVKQGENSGMSFSVSSNKGSGSGRSGSGSAPPPSGADLQQLMAQYQSEIGRIRDQAGKDAKQALTQASNLPEKIGNFQVRAMAYQMIARATWKKEPEVAREALSLLIKVSSQSTVPGQRADYLLTAADLLDKMGDEENAKKAIDATLKKAEELFENDNNPNDPNKALKEYWPSTNAWAQAIAIAFRVEPDKVDEILAGIKDDEIRTSLRVSYAMALAGATSATQITMVTSKGNNSISMSTNREN